ncbi:ParA family protein [Polynucleobacter sp. AP-Capit-er-40B-B4]|uniref:ParA family protein n=1 Tax=Polynucleobacter sp. AP-Capit-er-40B-B4 TaxID=2576927 RepID=UPI001C0B8B4B|nr:ParA family protein [Polynucleobacter sp. AP-Capit-er-40B-B4]MBU3581999.1 ParA family protein [Polynucleobacter sp. AP-Capit-er-40B-B4]
MRPIKILVTNQKGGVGKSTISANLAGYLNIDKNHSISLIDFDKQASSTGIARKTPGGNIQTYKAGLTYEQSSGLTMLDAKTTLRNYSKDADITIADLTWTYGMSYDFMNEFDVIIVPSSLSQIETASTEIFILEYIQNNSAKINAKEQVILVAPSRIEPGQESEIQFNGLGFLSMCFVTPPIYRIPDINKHLHISYFFQSQQEAIANNFCEFGSFVYRKLKEKMESPIPARLTAPAFSIRNTSYVGSPQYLKAGALREPPAKNEVRHKAAEKESFLDFIPAFLRRK